MSYSPIPTPDKNLIEETFFVEATDPNQFRDRWSIRISWAASDAAALELARPFFEKVGADAWMTVRRGATYAASERVWLPEAEKDQIIVWTAQSRVTSAARVRLYDGLNDHAGKKVLLVTDLDSGVSVTNGAADIVNAACERFDLDKNKLVFIEHGERASGGAECFAVAEFDLDDRDGKLKRPRWRHLFSSAIHGVLGRVKNG